MRKLAVVFLLVATSWPAALWAADLSALYSDAELSERKARYAPAIRWNFENLILGSLTPAERQTLGSVQLELPLRGQGALRDHPMAFYAGGKTVVVPIMSVKFFDDLTLATAFFWARDLSLQPVSDYVAMLKYRSAAEIGGRYPPPLEAFGLSYDIWKTDKKIDGVSQQALKSGLVWIMAHELGHIFYGHRGYAGLSADEAQKQEAMADLFANRIMRRIGVAPLGMPQFFMAMAHLEPSRGDFQSNDAWNRYLQTKATHPLTADRMRALADDLRKRPGDFASNEADVERGTRDIEFVAGQIQMIGDILADPDIQRTITAKALATDLVSLKRWQQSSSAPSVNAFDGRFVGAYARRIQGGESEVLDANMVLRRRGKSVTGRFWFGLGEGVINGIVRGNRMTFEWTWGEYFGRGALNADPDTGTLIGAWGYKESADGGGTWKLRRE